MPGAHLQDTLILENKEQGIYAGGRGAAALRRAWRDEDHQARVQAGQRQAEGDAEERGPAEDLTEGQDLGVYLPGTKLELMEGTHKLELRGDQLKEPVQFEVTVKARDTTEQWWTCPRTWQ